MAASTPAQALSQATCFACGEGNPHGLRLRFTCVEAGRVEAGWEPRREFEGFQGVIHGGIVSTVLDEAMSKAVSSLGWQALTAELRVRLKHTVCSGESLQVRGWVVERRKRRIVTEATLTDGQGVEKARAWATFLQLG
jgi:acyl-coenzyme A thioesterase PaaI-like protein